MTKIRGRKQMSFEATIVQIATDSLRNFEAYLYERENAPATIQKYRTDIQKFLRFLNDEKTITKRKLLEYKEWLLRNYKVTSVNSMLAALNQFLVFLGASDLRVKRVKIQRNLFLSQEKELTKQEYERLLSTAKKEGNEQLALCMETIASTGIRISELKYFTLETMKHGHVEIHNKGKYRRIFIPKWMRKRLLEFCKKKNIRTGPIFVTKSGQAKNRSNIWREMKRLKEKSGIDGRKIFPHNLRHYFARLYYKMTKDLSGLADILGHSSLNITRIYTANTGATYQRQLDKIMEGKREKTT